MGLQRTDQGPHESTPYLFHVGILRVIDGDTVEVLADLGFYASMTIRVRVAKIDAPEIRGREKIAGKAARLYAIEWFAAIGNQAALLCYGQDKYGRWVGDLLDTEGNSLHEAMLSDGHAKPYH